MRFTHQLLHFSLLLNCLITTSCNNYRNIFNFPIIESGNTITCVKFVAKKYFPCGTLVTIVNQSKDDNQLVQAITNKICYSIVLKSWHEHNWLVGTDVYIITSDDVTEFLAIILQLKRDILWNPESKFVLSMQNLDSGEISDIFKICSRYKIYNVLLLTPSNKNTFMYTYYPFSHGKCGDNLDTVNLGNCDTINEATNIFSNKMPTTLKNCSFRVVARENIPNFIFSSSNFTINKKPALGLEQYLLQTIQEREEVTINYTLTNGRIYGIVLSNGSSTGLLKYLQDDEADIVAGGFLLIKNRIEIFNFIGGYNFASFSVFTPNVGYPVWEDVYREFGITTWISILFTFCVYSVIFYKINNSLMNNTHDRMSIFLTLWGCLCGNSGIKTSKVKNIKMITICWIWFSFFITSFYNTALFSLITRRVQIKKHIKPENLDELPYQPCITDIIRTYFLVTYNKNLPEGELNPECYYTDTALNFIVSRNDLYTIELDDTYALQELNYIDEEGIPKLDSTAFSNNGAQGFYVMKGFAFKDKIREYMSRMHQNGLMAKQLQMILQQSKSAALRRLQRFKKIRLRDLKIHFYILLLGYSISMICLICEINNKRLLKKSKKYLPQTH